MPYVITTAGRLPDGRLHQWSDPIAVATLEEARDVARTTFSQAATSATLDNLLTAHQQVDDLPVNGGTIGPLPDGTVIEVRRVDWMDFELMVVPGPVAATVPITTFDSDEYRDGLIRAFNA